MLSKVNLLSTVFQLWPSPSPPPPPHPPPGGWNTNAGDQTRGLPPPLHYIFVPNILENFFQGTSLTNEMWDRMAPSKAISSPQQSYETSHQEITRKRLRKLREIFERQFEGIERGIVKFDIGGGAHNAGWNSYYQREQRSRVWRFAKSENNFWRPHLKLPPERNKICHQFIMFQTISIHTEQLFSIPCKFVCKLQVFSWSFKKYIARDNWNLGKETNWKGQRNSALTSNFHLLAAMTW